MTAEQFPSPAHNTLRAPPGRVLWFERLFYLSAALSLVRFLLDRPDHMPTVSFVVLYILLMLQLLLIWLTARRRKNWARWVLLVFFVLWVTAGLVYDGVTGGVGWKSPSTVSVVLRLAQLLFEDIGLILIFTGRSSRRWFMRTGQPPKDWPA
jgi:hypothetical protein